MAKIKHARKLRDLPPQRHAGVLDEVSDGSRSDRAVAIVGAAYVDLVLLEAITYRLPRGDDNVIEQLFGERGPLQAFGARIQLGYLLGIYASAALKDLRAIKEIRNACAHSAETLSFEQPDISKLANALHFQRQIQYRGKALPATPRERYVRTVELVTDLLLSDMTLHRSGRGGERVLQMLR